MNNLCLVLYIVLFILMLMYFNKNDIKENYQSEEPCSDNLSDLDYLEHMIPHHQVAVDISILLQKKSKNPTMQYILRKLIWTQNYEIKMMEEIIKKMPKKISSEHKMYALYNQTVGDFTKPNKLGLTNTYCDPHFFDPEEHMKHLQEMELNDIMYIEHMIPHHQVAVDMSKKLLKNTQNDFMVYLAYRIIQSQQEEIILLNDLLKESNYRYQSKLLY